MSRLAPACLTFVVLAFTLAFSVGTAWAGVWWHADSQRVFSAGEGEQPDGSVALTLPEYNAAKAIPRRWRKDVAGKPGEMSGAEKTALALSDTRATALARLVDAELQLLGLDAVKTRLELAGKSTTKIDARIATLNARIATAIGNLP